MGDTLTIDERVAGLLLDGRREQGLTVSGLAAAAGVPERVIEEAEQGRGLTSDAALSVLPLLGVDPTPMLEVAHGAILVPAVDRDHARTMTYLSRIADVGEGWLVFPDVAAIPPLDVCTEDDVVKAVELRDRFFAVPGTSLQWVANKLMCAASLLSVLSAMVFGAYFIIAGIGVICGMQGAIPSLAAGSRLLLIPLSLAVAFFALRARYPEDQAERDRFEVRTAERRVEYERLSGVTRQGVRTGYLISDEGVEALLTGGSGLERRDYHASAFRSVTVREEDATHVTVEVDSVVGRVVMNWLPRSRSLMDLVARWRAGCDAPHDDGLQ